MKLDYKRAGVDIEKANLFIKSIKDVVGKTRRKGALGAIGGFGAFFDPQKANVKSPLLVSSCDGVGTKLKIAFLSDIHDTVGIDLVAMSVNDVICSGAEPLFFLDYIATGKMNAAVLKSVVSGISSGCRTAGCVLAGGETAEMPGMYKTGEYDLAGFCVGIVDQKKVIGASRVRVGNAVIGLASSGLHSNGFSLVRKVFSTVELKARAQDFLMPTRIYAKPLSALLKKFNQKNFGIRAAAHITGGGFFDKAVRVIPPGASMVLYKSAWTRPEVFVEIQHRSHLSDKEMYSTFNMGIGFVLVVEDSLKMSIVRQAARCGVKAMIIGEIVGGSGNVVIA